MGRLQYGGVAVGENKVWGSCSMEEQCCGKWRSCSAGSFGVGRCVLGEFQCGGVTLRGSCVVVVLQCGGVAV